MTEANRRQRKKPPAKAAINDQQFDTPLQRPGFRDPEYVQSVMLRMGTGYVDALDELCKTNERSRREIVEVLIAEAALELKSDPAARILPLT